MATFDTGEEIKKIAKKFGILVSEELDVKNIYLYGSYVKGTQTENSDIDIAVIGDDFSGDFIDDMMLLMRIRRRVDNRIEPRPIKTSDFNSSNPISKEIIETGIMIM